MRKTAEASMILDTTTGLGETKVSERGALSRFTGGSESSAVAQ